MTERNWIQLNKYEKCPNCGKFTLRGITVVNDIKDPLKNTFIYKCSNCEAEFEEEKQASDVRITKDTIYTQR